MPRGTAKRGRRRKRVSNDRIADKAHVAERSEIASIRAQAGQSGADLVICKRARPVLVLHEGKTRLARWHAM